MQPSTPALPKIAPPWAERARAAHAAAEAARQQAAAQAALDARAAAYALARERFPVLMAAADLAAVYEHTPPTRLAGTTGRFPSHWALRLDGGYRFTLSDDGPEAVLALEWECPRPGCRNMIYGGTFTTLAELGAQLARLDRYIGEHAALHADAPA